MLLASRFGHVVLFNKQSQWKNSSPGDDRQLFSSGARYADGVCALDGKLTEWNLQDPEAAVRLISLQVVYAGTTSG